LKVSKQDLEEDSGEQVHLSALNCPVATFSAAGSSANLSAPGVPSMAGTSTRNGPEVGRDPHVDRQGSSSAGSQMILDSGAL